MQLCYAAAAGDCLKVRTFSAKVGDKPHFPAQRVESINKVSFQSFRHYTFSICMWQVKALLSQKCDPTRGDYGGKTPLHIASVRQFVQPYARGVARSCRADLH